MGTIIVALDETDPRRFEEIIDQLDPSKCMVKIGSVTYNSIGKDSIFKASLKGFKIFLDLKLHDIPNTVNKTIKGLVDMPIEMMTVHTSGGKQMLEASKSAALDSGIKIIGVTTLTSLNAVDTNLIYKRSPELQVETMAKLAYESLIDGVVCSPHEVPIVKMHSNLMTITPGIRLSKNNNDDQERSMNPIEAIKNGSDFLVIGRPITNSKNISKSLNNIYESIS